MMAGQGGRQGGRQRWVREEESKQAALEAYAASLEDERDALKDRLIAAQEELIGAYRLVIAGYQLGGHGPDEANETTHEREPEGG